MVLRGVVAGMVEVAVLGELMLGMGWRSGAPGVILPGVRRRLAELNRSRI